MKTVRWFALVAAATAATSMLFSPTAFATPPVGAESVVISQSTVDGIDYITREIIIQPGGSTGWHYHDGRTFGVVREGTLTRTMEDCSEMISPTGVGVTEEGGNVHVGRNLGPVPVVLWVVRIAPAGTPWAMEVPPPPGCPIYGFA